MMCSVIAPLCLIMLQSTSDVIIKIENINEWQNGITNCSVNWDGLRLYSMIKTCYLMCWKSSVVTLILNISSLCDMHSIVRSTDTWSLDSTGDLSWQSSHRNATRVSIRISWHSKQRPLLCTRYDEDCSEIRLLTCSCHRWYHCLVLQASDESTSIIYQIGCKCYDDKLITGC